MVIQREAKEEMQKLTGLSKNPFPFHHVDEDETVQDPPDAPAPTQAAAVPGAAAPMPLELEEDINAPANALVWRRAALLVYQTQMVRTFYLHARYTNINFCVRTRLPARLATTTYLSPSATSKSSPRAPSDPGRGRIRTTMAMNSDALTANVN